MILMPWLLPGNSCPEREMNGCPWASFSSSSFLSSFFSSQCLTFREIMVSIDVVLLQHLLSLPRQTLASHQGASFVVGRHDSHGINPTDVIEEAFGSSF